VAQRRAAGARRTAVPASALPRDEFNDFDFDEDDAGLKCPMGSHIRRCNPRNGRIVQRTTNHARRIVRRGIPYGPPFEPGVDDGIERGLLGVFLCASLAVQFESIQYDWMNLALQDPRITGTNDALVGANDKGFSCFRLPSAPARSSSRASPVRAHARRRLLLPPDAERVAPPRLDGLIVQVVENDGVELAFVVEGDTDGDPVLLLHGFPDTSRCGSTSGARSSTPGGW
jgi:hypothetical protein